MNEMKPIARPEDRLRQAMDMRGFRAVDLAEKSGLTKAAISCYMNGRYEPKAQALFKLGQALNVNETWLAGFDVPMERTPRKEEALASLVTEARRDAQLRELLLQIGELSPAQRAAIAPIVSQLRSASGTNR